MPSSKPFSKKWWWQVLLNHTYLCKWKYLDLEEMKADSELTDFIIGRIESKIENITNANGHLEVLEELEMFTKLNEDDFDRGKGKHLLERFIENQLHTP